MGGSMSVIWELSATYICSNNIRLSSSGFLVYFFNVGFVPFAMTLFAQARSSKAGAPDFQTTGGFGRVEIKCMAEHLPDECLVDLNLQVGIARKEDRVRHQDFSSQRCCGIRRIDLASGVDACSNNLCLRLQFIPR